MPRLWVEYFSQPEFQVILSGSMVSISVKEMQMHTRYSGGYNGLSKQIVWLWRTLGAMGPKDLAKFLKFVTSCERPPLLGFSELRPPLTVQKISRRERLPNASTCFNILKLPSYKSEKQLREKLVQAIRSGAVWN